MLPDRIFADPALFLKAPGYCQSSISDLPVEHFRRRTCHKYSVLFSVPTDQKVAAEQCHADFIVSKTV